MRALGFLGGKRGGVEDEGEYTKAGRVVCTSARGVWGECYHRQNGPDRIRIRIRGQTLNLMKSLNMQINHLLRKKTPERPN